MSMVEETKVDESQGYTIPEVAQILGVSKRQVQRYLRDGKLQSRLVEGKFGPEHRIDSIPTDIPGQKRRKSPDKPSDVTLAFVREQHDTILQLSQMLGRAQERILNLEAQVKLLTGPKVAWWRRILPRKTGGQAPP